MNCKSVQNRLSAYVDRELGGDELLQIRSHISTCKQCRSEADEIRALKSLLGGVSCPEPPDGLSERLTASMMNLRYEEPKKSFKVSALLFAGVTACSMLATLLFLSYGMNRRMNSPTSSNATGKYVDSPTFSSGDSEGPVISAANFGPR